LRNAWVRGSLGSEKAQTVVNDIRSQGRALKEER
jgi:hypothetical protein